MRHYVYHSMMNQAGLYGLYQDDLDDLKSLQGLPVKADESVVRKVARKSLWSMLLSLISVNRF